MTDAYSERQVEIEAKLQALEATAHDAWTRQAKALERIADALEGIVPPLRHVNVEPSTLTAEEGRAIREAIDASVRVYGTLPIPPGETEEQP